MNFARMAILLRRRYANADLYEKHQAEIAKDEIGSLVKLIPYEETTDIIEELVINDEGTEDTVNQINWESKQREFESLWQRDTEKSEEHICEEYLEEPEESDIDFEAWEIETVESTLPPRGATNKLLATEAEVLADILRNASDYSDVRRGLCQYQQVKEKAWKLLSDSERKCVCQMLPEPIAKLSNAKREGLIVNFYEMEEFHLSTQHPMLAVVLQCKLFDQTHVVPNRSANGRLIREKARGKSELQNRDRAVISPATVVGVWLIAKSYQRI